MQTTCHKVVPEWSTPSGYISDSVKGQSVLIVLICDTKNIFTTFEVISGNLPVGLKLNGPDGDLSLPIPSITGIIDLNCASGTYTFNVRAKNTTGGISDRSFAITVNSAEPANVYPNTNLGTWIAGTYCISSVAPIVDIPELMGNIQVVSGSLPANLLLNSINGNITGYINPSNLYNTEPIYPNFEPGAPNVSGSTNSAVFTFTIGYKPEVEEAYYITIVSQQN